MRTYQLAAALLSVLVLAGIALVSCSREPMESQPAVATPAAAPAPSPVERGEMLVIGGGCHDCHTPKTMGPDGPEADMTKMLSGHPEAIGTVTGFAPDPGNPWVVHTNEQLTAWSGPWGVSYAANLTPDQNTGLGIWTEEMFVKALQSGKHMGTSRPILPPMPWNWYGKLPEEDLKAMYAYLKTIPPISNRVPEPVGPAGAGEPEAEPTK